jgi:hypothetical protein
MSPYVIACQYPIRAGCSRVRAYPAGKEVGLKTEYRDGVRIRRVRVGNDRDPSGAHPSHAACRNMTPLCILRHLRHLRH